jgi:mannose-6-phosphate isomerase-like protein (cupin superfamily)
MHLSKLDHLEAFTTLDGSTIREIAGVGGANSAPADHQSLAEATVPVGGHTIAHYHRATEELYFFTAGRGRMTVGEEQRDVTAGDCVVIAPGAVHGLVNTGDEPLVLLCCCAPAYTHEDTVLVDVQASSG